MLHVSKGSRFNTTIASSVSKASLACVKIIFSYSVVPLFDIPCFTDEYKRI